MDLDKAQQYQWHIEVRSQDSWGALTDRMDLSDALAKFQKLRETYPDLEFQMVSDQYPLTEMISLDTVLTAKMMKPRFADKTALFHNPHANVRFWHD